MKIYSDMIKGSGSVEANALNDTFRIARAKEFCDYPYTLAWLDGWNSEPVVLMESQNAGQCEEVKKELLRAMAEGSLVFFVQPYQNDVYDKFHLNADADKTLLQNHRAWCVKTEKQINELDLQCGTIATWIQKHMLQDSLAQIEEIYKNATASGVFDAERYKKKADEYREALIAERQATGCSLTGDKMDQIYASTLFSIIEDLEKMLAGNV